MWGKVLACRLHHNEAKYEKELNPKAFALPETARPLQEEQTLKTEDIHFEQDQNEKSLKTKSRGAKTLGGMVASGAGKALELKKEKDQMQYKCWNW